MISWLDLPKTGVVPRPTPLDIANMVALLAGGNLLSCLPPLAEWCTDETIRRHLGGNQDGIRVQIAWGKMVDMDGRDAGQE